MSQLQMPSGIMWAQQPSQNPGQNMQAPQQPGMMGPYNPAPTGQNPQMLGMGQMPSQMGMPPMSSQTPGTMPPQGNGSMGQSMPAGQPLMPNPSFTNFTQMPGAQMPWTGNTPYMGGNPQNSMQPSSGTPTGMGQGPQMGRAGFAGMGMGMGANAQPNGVRNFLPGGGIMPQRKPGIFNQAAGPGAPSQPNPAAQFPGLAQNTAQSPAPGGPGTNMTPGGGNSNGPIAASTPGSPSASGQNDPGYQFQLQNALQSGMSPAAAASFANNQIGVSNSMTTDANGITMSPSYRNSAAGQDALRSQQTGYTGGGSSGYTGGGAFGGQMGGVTANGLYQAPFNPGVPGYSATTANPFSRSLASPSSPFTGVAQNQGGQAQGPPQSGYAPAGYSAPRRPYVPMWQRGAGVMA